MKRLITFLVGVALGVGLALLIGWNLFPRVTYDPTPAAMRRDYRDEYLRLVALSYQADGDLARAEERLRTLNSEDYAAPLVELTERWIAAARTPELIRPLVQLAEDLGAATPAMAGYLEGAGE